MEKGAMEFISRMTTKTDASSIIEELAQKADAPFDVGFLFISHLPASTTREVVSLLTRQSRVRNLIGCTCYGIIGNQDEIERQPAVSLIMARLPQVKITPFFINQSIADQLRTPQDWYNFLEVYPSENPTFLTFPDPFLFDMNRFLAGINMAYPECSVVGGLASGASQPRENQLIVNGEFYDDGLVGLILTGPICVETIVSQGCRPIGETFIVTQGQDNVINSLAGRPLVDVLNEVLSTAPTRDKLLAQEAVFVGIAINEYKHVLKRGDFLIRALIGIDPQTGAGAIADYIRPGQTVQFHVRDADAASEDLNELLKSQLARRNQERPKGALVFSCNGRGENLFRVKNHDIGIIQNHIGPIPAAGFFCAGEIGPVGKNNFLHGFTNSIALFYTAKKM